MKCLDLSLPTPAANLACDEVLLDGCEDGKGDEVLRFWESTSTFVVLGYGNCPEMEANLPACQLRNIPVFRRCSGGGSVVQGPGCLNYSLILRFDESSPIATVTGANRFIMEKHRQLVTSVLKKTVRVEGFTDLTIDHLKFSGNSQRRRRHSLLFHGTFLLSFDLALITEILLMPPKQPDYRANRAHQQFLTNLHIAPDALKAALRETWQAHDPLIEPPLGPIDLLGKEKYESPDWRFQ